MYDTNLLNNLEFFKVLDYCRPFLYTENGIELLFNSLPLTDVEEICLEGRLVSEAKEILIKNELPPIQYLPLLDETIKKSKLDGASLSVEQIKNILKLLEISRSLFIFFKDKEECDTLKIELIEKLFIDKKLESEISSIFDQNGEISDNASKALKDIRFEIKEKNFTLQKVINRILRQLKDSQFVQDDFATISEGRVVLPIKAEHKRHVKGFIHSESASGQTVYIEPTETLDLNNEILSLKFAEKREIDKILKDITKKISVYANNLENLLKIIAKLDLVFAKAKYSLEINGSFPTFNNNKPFELINARHPILLKKFGKEKTIPLNFIVKDNIVTLITGPNAGGKTVVLKTLGLNLLLAYSGFHIPIDPDSNFRLFNSIIIDIGDEQSIESSLSTFSSHLSKYKFILEYADNNTLVLLDEIGTGTDPEEGGAIAAAILNTLKNRGTITLATTHLGKLKVLANETIGFMNASMEYDLQKLEPTYKFRQGIPGSSYAFEVAERIGFNNQFLTDAKSYLNTDKINIEKFLIELENKSNILSTKLKQAEIENSKLKGLTELYKQKLEKLESEKKEIINKAKAEADLLLKNVNSIIEKVIKEIKESSADSKIIKKGKQEIEYLKQNVKLNKDEIKKNEPNFKIGDFVKLNNTNTVGIIESIVDENDITLLVGNLKVKANKNSISVISKDEYKKDTLNKKVNIANINYTLDIRGERVNTVTNKIIKFLDESYTNGLERVEILHGKGTGALKKIVWDILKEQEFISKFYFAPIESGGEGITIVELK